MLRIGALYAQGGRTRIRLDLLNEKSEKFWSFCREYGLDDIAFAESNIHIVRSEEGQALADIRNPGENEAAADFITDRIRHFTGDGEAAVHVSIAGGRKTMGYYAGYALSLFGREQDRLSHVLVDAPYESHPKFFYPTRESHIIHTRDGRPLDTREARVMLAEIPFIRLRSDIPRRLLQGRAGFTETISLAQKADQPATLVIAEDRQSLEANGLNLTLPHILLAFYLWMVEKTVVRDTMLLN